MSDLLRDPREQAKELGLELVTPGPRDVFLDIDSPADETVMREMLDLYQALATRINDHLEIWIEKTTISRSGNKHVYLRTNYDLTEEERILLQAIFGSDRKREMYAYFRTKSNHLPANLNTVFFEKPAEASETVNNVEKVETF